MYMAPLILGYGVKRLLKCSTCSPTPEILTSDTQHRDSNLRCNLPIFWYSHLMPTPMRLASPGRVGTGQGLAFLGREASPAVKGTEINYTTLPLPSGRPGRASEQGSSEAVSAGFDATPWLQYCSFVIDYTTCDWGPCYYKKKRLG